MNTTDNTNPPTLDEAIQIVADLVFQYGYRMDYHGKPALYDGGLSALERAFDLLERAGCKMNANGTIQESALEDFSDALLAKNK